ncbi:hypothetical protein M9H77_32140 [Catharanthus roseus]|uniref:Uncharacterized protein n=1 Tax=Catharanthus roseus TaxID=4058 RepID=A0ACC0A6B4_CATRO|nr:hypothetical protein M9H77_32140 [Catharanthus roseus]
MVCRGMGLGAVLCENVMKLDDPILCSSSFFGLVSTILWNLAFNTLSQFTRSVVFLFILEGIMLRQFFPFACFDLPPFRCFITVHPSESKSTSPPTIDMMKPHDRICSTSKLVEQTKQSCQSSPPHGLNQSPHPRNSKKLLALKSKASLALEAFGKGKRVRVLTLLLDI